ncbi:Planctomycete cytochrome C [Posidoniimonas corsicana]|uniref:Planctomycete cytochrome C n=1 Tax=Posidoniimonas corsicana TaxID=1938618 RepID=A0A5C5VF22_9BACT|nr:PSD1 and planctomycete cytochrome C domain-containing protein [Posidoniimonas corsicana]TWT37238.1 Planctomycete cytochrome C [Posidoniimonas corsicana]
MQLRFSWLLVAILVAGSGSRAATAGGGFSGEQLEFFETKVRPLLAEHCYACHSAKTGKTKGGVRLDHRDMLITGGDSGPAIVPGEPDASLLLEAVRYESYQMPPTGKLPDQDIQTLARWVAMGAPWPEEPLPQLNSDEKAFDLPARREAHWAWQPVEAPTPPAVADPQWPADPIDQFVLAKLEASSLRPAPPKSRTALLRRLYFDLIGLPPSSDEVQAFLDDESPDAVATVVDRLLASERFGERWGRHWLDLVRYAESRGHEYDFDALNAYQYRDYVIRALNADVPYDQFLREHIAGDLIDEPRLNPERGFNESLLGTGFWHLGEWVHSPVDTRKDETDRFDNMIDVLSKSMLAMTVSCARCHDHKFDAISMADYYSLSGFLQSSGFRQTRFESGEHNRRVAERLAELDDRYRRRLRELIGSAGLPAENEATAQRPSKGLPAPPTGAATRTLIDYAAATPREFMQDGFGFGQGARPAGELTISDAQGGPGLRLASAASAAFDPFWRGLESRSEDYINGPGRLDPKHWAGRTLRTPTIELATGEVHLLVRGGGRAFACVDSHRTVSPPLHQETIIEFPTSDEVRWVAMPLPRFRGARIHFEFCPNDDDRLEVLRVVERGEQADSVAHHDQPSIDGNEAEALRRWVAGEPLPPGIGAALAHRLAPIVRAPSEFLSAESARELQDLVGAWSVEREELRGKVMRASDLAMASMELNGEDDRLLIRGNSSSPAAVQPRRFLEAIDGGGPMSIPAGSGRAQLADRITDPQNPLTARVIVNRVWGHLMGDGIVRSPDNFGVLGQRPTHPELLDYLATEFVADGQSLKRLIRRLALTSTYAMSGRAGDDALSADPLNLLWSHLPPKRLEAEAIRDALLVLSGRYDPAMYGRPVPVHLTPFMQGRGRPKESGPLDGAGRRSIYVAVRRNFLPPMALAFDMPSPFSSMGRRTRSNVPAQALVLLNSPFVAEQTSAWAERTHAAAEDSHATARKLYVSGLGREPSEEELESLVEFVAAGPAVEGWAEAAHALVNSKEFIYLP